MATPLSLRVFEAEARIYRRTWRGSVVSTFLNPILYMLAMGIGLGSLVDANMPGGVPRTSTLALTNATLPYAVALAGKGWKQACIDDQALSLGVNVVDGEVTYAGVADAFEMECRSVSDFLGAARQV